MRRRWRARAGATGVTLVFERARAMRFGAPLRGDLHRRRTWPHVSLTIVLTSAVWLAAVAGASPAAADDMPVTVMQYNMCGGVDTCPNTTLLGPRYQVVGRIFNEIQARDLDVVTLNEVCRLHFEHLADELHKAGIKMSGEWRQTSLRSSCNNKGAGRQGNAIFVRGRAENVAEYHFEGDDKRLRQGPGITSTRRMLCVIATSIDRLRACVTHLDTDDSDVALEVSEIARVFSAGAAAHPYLIGGDFNAAPGDSAAAAAFSQLYAPPWGRGSFYEADMTRGIGDAAARGGSAATHGEGKLDYLFVSATWFSDDMTAEVVEPPACYDRRCSDHRMLIGHLKLKRHTVNDQLNPGTPGTGPAPKPGSGAQAGPRPFFQLPFSCGQRWRATTRAKHKPNSNSLDFLKVGGGSKYQAILASYAGRVIRSGWDKGGGWMVKIDHGGQWGTSYVHMNERPMVTVGQQVQTGQQLGRVGQTGDAPGGPHLHYQQWVGRASNTVRAAFAGALVTTRIGRARVLVSGNCTGPSGGGATQFADATGDRVGDMIAWHGPDLWIYRNRGYDAGEVFAGYDRRQVTSGFDPARTRLADVTGDGLADMIAWHGPDLWIYRNRGYNAGEVFAGYDRRKVTSGFQP